MWLVYVCFLALRHVGLLTPQPGIEPQPPALKCKVLTTGPLGKPQCSMNLKQTVGIWRGFLIWHSTIYTASHGVG